jgi:hypothetical protein
VEFWLAKWIFEKEFGLISFFKIRFWPTCLEVSNSLFDAKEIFSIISASFHQDFHKEGYAFYLQDDYRNAESWMKKKCEAAITDGGKTEGAKKEGAKKEKKEIGAVLIFEVPEATDDFWKK